MKKKKYMGTSKEEEKETNKKEIQRQGRCASKAFARTMRG